jgi:FMN-dependent NADH-azoreductase
VTILHIDSSINGENSASRTLSRSIVEQFKGAQWGEKVIYRDLAESPLPHLTLDAFADTSTLDEFLAADTIVIGAPMYNFSVPSQLKAWIDRIVIAGSTFRYTEQGPEGLAKGKRVIIAIARGGIYSAESPAAGLEHVETYLRGVFNLIGIEPEFVVAEGINLSPDHRASAIENALGETLRLAA